MQMIKPRGRLAKRMAFYARIRRMRRVRLGQMIVRDIREKVVPLFSKNVGMPRIEGVPFIRDEWQESVLDANVNPGRFV